MSKAFVRGNEDGEEDDEPTAAPALPAGASNYMTKSGYLRLREEFEKLVKVERPALVQVVSWAAGNGDRSENGDYIYGKKRLREIDRRIRYLMKRLESAGAYAANARAFNEWLMWLSIRSSRRTLNRYSLAPP